MAHRQFPWQVFPPSAVNITRYYMIYEHPPLKRIIQTVIGGADQRNCFFTGWHSLEISCKPLHLIYSSKHPNPWSITKRSLSDPLRTKFSRNLSDLKKLLLGEHQMNDRFAYAYNYLKRAYPLIKMIHKGNNSLVRPIPTILLWRFTSGGPHDEIYYQPGFTVASGYAF